jgi:hypothetical protein
MRLLKTLILMIPLLLCALGAQTPIIHRRDWPVIQKFDLEIKIDANSERIFFSIPIRNQAGRVLYTLACIGGSTSYLDHLGGKMDENFNSPMCFFLGEGDKDVTGKLLCEDGAAHWYSRGQIYFSELVGVCGEYPEFGKLRHFRLRGMMLTIQFQNIDLDSSGLPRFMNIHISGRPDRSVTSEIAERPGYLRPDKDCLKIRKGVEPRMFRDSHLNWVEEKELLKKRP